MGSKNRFLEWFLFTCRLLSIGIADVKNEKKPPFVEDLLELLDEEELFIAGAWLDDVGATDAGEVDDDGNEDDPSTLCHVRLERMGLLLSWLPNFWAILLGVPKGEGM